MENKKRVKTLISRTLRTKFNELKETGKLDSLSAKIENLIQFIRENDLLDEETLVPIHLSISSELLESLDNFAFCQSRMESLRFLINIISFPEIILELLENQNNNELRKNNNKKPLGNIYFPPFLKDKKEEISI